MAAEVVAMAEEAKAEVVTVEVGSKRLLARAAAAVAAMVEAGALGAVVAAATAGTVKAAVAKVAVASSPQPALGKAAEAARAECHVRRMG